MTPEQFAWFQAEASKMWAHLAMIAILLGGIFGAALAIARNQR